MTKLLLTLCIVILIILSIRCKPNQPEVSPKDKPKYSQKFNLDVSPDVDREIDIADRAQIVEGYREDVLYIGIKDKGKNEIQW